MLAKLTLCFAIKCKHEHANFEKFVPCPPNPTFVESFFRDIIGLLPEMAHNSCELSDILGRY